MRIVYILFLLLGSAVSAYAQQADSIATTSIYRTENALNEPEPLDISPEDMRDAMHLYSSDMSKCVKRTLFGYGALIIGIPTTILGAGFIGVHEDFNIFSGGLTIIGGLITLSSIPLFISAHHFRNKAKKLQMSLSAIEVPKYVDQANYVPALRFSVNF